MVQLKSILLGALLSVLVISKSIYNPQKSYVSPITNLNFESQITKIRQTTKYVTILHFYKSNDDESKLFAPLYDEFTNENRGIFRIGGCDCEENARICEKEGIKQFPTVRVYPPQPIPSVDYEGPLNVEGILKLAAKYIHNNIVEVNEANINTFVSENPSVPKVLLFTEKKGFPLVYKGLSVEFEKKISVGIVRSDQRSIVEKYSIKAFPKIIVIKTNQKKHDVYSGELKFMPIFDFLNIYSEIFVPGGGSSSDSAASKHWLTELVPELYYKSANDICLKVEGVICVILMDGSERPKTELIEEMKKLNNKFERQISRGNVFKFMWLNTTREKKWAEVLEFQGDPMIVMLNPGRRKRFLIHDGPFSFASIVETIERINGGDAKFNKIGDVLPELTVFT